jgi:hypothetical protein
MLYKVVLRGECWSQSIQNILWYRTGLGFDIDGLQIGGAFELAESVQNVVWDKMKPCLPTTYKLNDIAVYPYNDSSLELVYQNPHIRPVLENGTSTAETDGTALCAIVKFNLEPTTILGNGVKPPRRGYIAFGPISSAQIDNSGHLIDSAFLDLVHPYKVFAETLKDDLIHLLPPVTFYPIRARQDKVLGVYKLTSFADINGVALRRLTSFRRSRMAEA